MTTQKVIGRCSILAALVSFAALVLFLMFSAQFEHRKKDYASFTEQHRTDSFTEAKSEDKARMAHVFQALHRKDFAAKVALTSGEMAAFLLLCFLILKKWQPNQALQHNDPRCHVPCVRTDRASQGRG